MPLDSDARAIFRAAVRAVDPSKAVHSSVRQRGRRWTVGVHSLVPDEGGRLLVVGLGKAAAAMADAVARVARSGVDGIVAVPRGYPTPRSRVRVVQGTHPVPSPASERAGLALLRFVRACRPADRLLFLISGGGSAVAEVPAEGLRLADVVRTTELLLASGAPIQSMNAVRRHLSQLKGGGLAVSSAAGGFGTLALSDVVGDTPDDIASGPTVPDPTTFRDAWRAVTRYRLAGRLPPGVRRRLEAGARGLIAETPKPNDRRFRQAFFEFAATNRTALEAAAHEARRRRYAARIISSRVVGETQPAARAFARELLRRRPGRRLALLSGGETTVTLGPHPGKGGRNQEFALACAIPIAGRADLLVLSAGTDGIDGPTDAAGGWVDGRTTDRARALGLDLRAILAHHAAYEALGRLGTRLHTGPTGTNVMDLHLGLVGG